MTINDKNICKTQRKKWGCLKHKIKTGNVILRWTSFPHIELSRCFCQSAISNYFSLTIMWDWKGLLNHSLSGAKEDIFVSLRGATTYNELIVIMIITYPGPGQGIIVLFDTGYTFICLDRMHRWIKLGHAPNRKREAAVRSEVNLGGGWLRCHENTPPPLQMQDPCWNF